MRAPSDPIQLLDLLLSLSQELDRQGHGASRDGAVVRALRANLQSERPSFDDIERAQRLLRRYHQA